jgi:hypothetical protein
MDDFTYTFHWRCKHKGKHAARDGSMFCGKHKNSVWERDEIVHVHQPPSDTTEIAPEPRPIQLGGSMARTVYRAHIL